MTTVLTSDKFKWLFMELTTNVLQSDECCKATAAQIVGKNSNPAMGINMDL